MITQLAMPAIQSGKAPAAASTLLGVPLAIGLTFALMCAFVIWLLRQGGVRLRLPVADEPDSGEGEAAALDDTEPPRSNVIPVSNLVVLCDRDDLRLVHR
jgi:hypothetical protein